MNPRATLQTAIARLREALDAHEQGQHGARERTLSLCRSLIASLETPIESLQRMGWAEPARNADCRVAVDLGLFVHMRRAEDAGAQGITAQQLAEQAGVHPVMISRIMKHLAAMDVVGEVGPDTFVTLRLSHALAEAVHRSGIICNQDITLGPLGILPHCLKESGYAFPFDRENRAFYAAHDTSLSVRDWCKRRPLYGAVYERYMAEVYESNTAIRDPGLYSVVDRLIDPFDPSKSDFLLVGIGFVAPVFRWLKRKFPDHPGRVILENIEEEYKYFADPENAFEVIRHNALAPQPIKGARTYYLRHAFRLYDQADCVRILEQLRPALEPGYSTVLLDEVTIPPEGASWPLTAFERMNIAVDGMEERSEEELRAIIHRAGFRVRRTHRTALGWTSLMELDLVKVGRE